MNELKHDELDPEQMEVLLWEFIDGGMPEAEKTRVEGLIREHAAWKAKYQELLDVHQLVSTSELDQPSMRFTRNVMEEISRLQIAPAARQYINSKVIWGIGAFFITVILGFLFYGFSQVNWSDASDSGSFIGYDLGALDYGKMFNNNFVNLFMMLNIVLGLMLLDRYLNNQKKRIIKEV